MLVKIVGETPIEIELDCANIPQILSGINNAYGFEVYDRILNNKHFYILENESGMVDMHPQMVMSDIDAYHTLYIIPDIGGDGVAILAAIAPVFAATAAGAIVGALISVALSIALSVIIQMLSPTLSFDGDAAEAQTRTSNLYGGTPNIREQGGSVPIAFGDVFCGGRLISSGISSEEITI